MVGIRISILLILSISLFGCAPSNQTIEKNGGDEKKNSPSVTEDIDKSDIESSSEKPIETKEISDEEKRLFNEKLFTQFEGLFYLVEEQIKIYRTYVLVNGLASVKPEDIEVTGNLLSQMSDKLTIIRGLEVPNESESITKHNELTLKAEKLHTALQKGQVPLNNNYAKQLNSIIENDIEPLKQDLYEEIGFISNIEETIVQEKEKINDESYNSTVPLDDQREEIYGDMECPPPNYCE